MHIDLINALIRSTFEYQESLLDFIGDQSLYGQVVTMKVLKISYVGIRHLHASFNSLPALIALAKSNGVYVGENCLGAWKLRGMIINMSDSMHSRLRKLITNTNTPLVLVIDGSTDFG